MNNPLSKEEILDKEHWDFVVSKGMSSIHTKTFPEAYKQQAITAMDEYAKQEAIAYDEWKNEKGYHWNWYYKVWTMGMLSEKKIIEATGKTHDQLYELYLLHKQTKGK